VNRQLDDLVRTGLVSKKVKVKKDDFGDVKSEASYFLLDLAKDLLGRAKISFARFRNRGHKGELSY